MKFKIDQNLPIEAADLLTVAGHSEKLFAGHPDAMTVYQQSLGGASDERIVDVCKDEGRILITADLDLSDIRRYPPALTPGYMVLRLPRQSKQALLDLLAKAISGIRAATPSRVFQIGTSQPRHRHMAKRN